MRSTLLVLLLLLAFDANAQDSVRRVSGSTVTVSGVASPVDSLPISSSYRKIELTQTLTSNSLEQAVRAVPGVQIDNRNNYALGDRITMRGIGARSFFGTRGIRVIKDDIPLTFADGQTNLEIIDPSQLSSVQVLHGPASSIFGNASGGTLIFKSFMPPSPGSIARGAASFGSHGYQRFTGALGSTSGPLSYGAYFTLDSMTGYRDWSGMNALHFGTQALYTFDEDALRLTFDNVSFSAQNPGALSQKLLDSNRRMAYAPNVRQKTGKDGRQSQIGLTYLGNGKNSAWTTSLYGVVRGVTNPTPQQIVDLDRNMFGLRSTWQAHLPDRHSDSLRGIVKWLQARDFNVALVLDAQYQLDKRNEFANDSGRKAALQTDQDEDMLALGLGANANFVIFDAFRVYGSLRYDLIRFEAKDHFISNSNPDQSGQVTMSKLSQTIGIAYEWLNDHSIFFNSSRGFETPTSTELANRPDGSGGYNNQLVPQVISNTELGVRGIFRNEYSNNTLRYNVSGFLARIQDALIPFQVPGQEGRDFYRNAGTIQNTGVELSLETQLFSRRIDRGDVGIDPVYFRPLLNVRIGYTYINSRFKDYVLRDTTNLDGNAQPGVHPHLGSLDITYRTPFDLEINANVRFAGKVAVNDANTFYSPEYTVLDLKASYEYTHDLERRSLRITPFVHVQNVLDRKYIGSFAINAFGNRYYEPSPERTIYAGIQVSL